MPEPPVESVAWARGAVKVRRFALPVSVLVGITAISGAFVAGNDAVCDYSSSCYYALKLISDSKEVTLLLVCWITGACI